ncbi:hypothetical protein JMUB5056_1015 [Leptotrichia hongkongensis]|uniref:Uncharacterized protein n=1 Tax=Leptotrichia hongkongensis TaxID=554406 RepID=A0A510L8T7_9FUSO|nr:hypothetical protein JMUB5056_1015 [Leptotrichia hongkongensis]
MMILKKIDKSKIHSIKIDDKSRLLITGDVILMNIN